MRNAYPSPLTSGQIELYEAFIHVQRHVFPERLRPGMVIPYVERGPAPLVWSCRYCGSEWSATEVPSRCRSCGAPRGK